VPPSRTGYEADSVSRAPTVHRPTRRKMTILPNDRGPCVLGVPPPRASLRAASVRFTPARPSSLSPRRAPLLGRRFPHPQHPSAGRPAAASRPPPAPAAARAFVPIAAHHSAGVKAFAAQPPPPTRACEVL
jgi:hypothetical protein